MSVFCVRVCLGRETHGRGVSRGKRIGRVSKRRRPTEHTSEATFLFGLGSSNLLPKTSARAAPHNEACRSHPGSSRRGRRVSVCVVCFSARPMHRTPAAPLFSPRPRSTHAPPTTQHTFHTLSNTDNAHPCPRSPACALCPPRRRRPAPPTRRRPAGCAAGAGGAPPSRDRRRVRPWRRRQGVRRWRRTRGLAL